MARVQGRILVLLATLAAVLAQPAYCLIITGGAGPITDMGWPKGAVEVANAKGRFRYVEDPPFGGGRFRFEYRGNTTVLNETLRLLAEIRAPKLELVVHDGPGRGYATNEDDGMRVNWAFTIWNAKSFYTLNWNPTNHWQSDSPLFRAPLPAPRIDVYVEEDGPIKWNNVKVPEGVDVIDERACAAPVDVTGGGVVTGTVYGMRTGKPIEGAAITLEVRSGDADPENPPEATTDEDGRFTVTEIPKGSYGINVQAEGYADRKAGYFGNTSGRSYTDALVYLATACEFEGTVVDSGGKPVEGARVRARDAIALNGKGYKMIIDPEPAVTDAQGHFVFPMLPEGHIGLWCMGGWYSQNHGELYEVTTPPRSPNAKPIRITVYGTGTIQVKVKGPDGKPFSGDAGVSLGQTPNSVGRWGGGGKVKEDGTFQFNDVPPDEYRIGLGHSFQEEDPTARVITVKSGKTVEVVLTKP
jgi:Carboxypeptidase regulatory-like domain